MRSKKIDCLRNNLVSKCPAMDKKVQVFTDVVKVLDTTQISDRFFGCSQGLLNSELLHRGVKALANCKPEFLTGAKECAESFNKTYVAAPTKRSSGVCRLVCYIADTRTNHTIPSSLPLRPSPPSLPTSHPPLFLPFLPLPTPSFFLPSLLPFIHHPSIHSSNYVFLLHVSASSTQSTDLFALTESSFRFQCLFRCQKMP